jgi:hypothetical protein
MSEDNAKEAAPKAELPMMRINGEPLQLPADFAVALAHVVVEWSRLEDAIERDLDWMMRFKVVAELAQEPPRSFNKKLELWRRAVNTLFRTIPQYRQMAAMVVPRAKEAAKLRNHLVHGMWPHQNPPPERFKIMSMTPVGDGTFRVQQAVIGREDLERLTAEILDIAGLVLGLTVSRMLHGHHGLLATQPAPARADQARPNPPKSAKRKRPQRS